MKHLNKKFFLFTLITLMVTCLLILGTTEKKETTVQGKQYSPAVPYKLTHVQPDGAAMTVFLQGDEWLHLGRTIDNYTILQSADATYFYGMLDGNGDLVASDVVAKDPKDRSDKDNKFLAKIKKGLDFSKKQRKEAENKKNDEDGGLANVQWGGVTGQFPTSGTRKMLIILGNFSDLSFVKTQTQFNDLFNTGSTSFKAFHTDNSYGALTVNCTVLGPYTPSITAASADADTRTYISALIDLANPYVDYSQFDNNGDGYVDGLFVVHAGYGEEAGAPSWTIWSHAWTLSSARYLDGVYLYRYATVPELRGASGSTITGIGVCVHEFGHLLGAPDLYDTDGTGSGGESWDCEKWDVMAGGSWNNSGDTPAQHNMYSKWKMGWSTPTTLTSTTTGVTLNNTAAYNEAKRVDTTTTNEFFILENRQQTGWDAYLPGHGLLIFHIDGVYIDGLTGNTVNVNPTHQGVDVEEADNVGSSSTYTADPFPGTGGKTSFTDTTTPNSKSWAGANTAKPLTNIAEGSGVISFDITVGGGGTSYCASQGNSQVDEWISRVQVGSLNNASGASPYTDFTSISTTLTPGASTAVTLTPGYRATAYTEYWKIWIDYNKDGDFADTGEEVFSKSGANAQSGSFTVSSSATGTTRMRVSMKYGAYPTSCETFTYGEVEDYTVTFSTSISYCASQGSNWSYEWISRVQVGSMNNASGAAGYTNFTSVTCTLTSGVSASVILTPGFASSTYSEYWKIWIDYNKDGDFTDAGEEVFSGYGTSAVSGSFTPTTKGSTRMRVSMKWNAYATSCETFSYGEVEDYTVNVL